MEPLILKLLILVAGALALGFVGYLVATILRESEGTDRMKEISLAIRQGAMVFLRREFTTLAVFTVVLFIVLAIFIEPRPLVAIAYVAGTLTSALAGWLGMNIATKANARTANAAIGSWAKGLRIAFSSFSSLVSRSFCLMASVRSLRVLSRTPRTISVVRRRPPVIASGKSMVTKTL